MQFTQGVLRSRVLNTVSPIPVSDLALLIERTADLWRLLDGQRLFVTGGSGFFGTWFLAGMTTAHDRLGLKLRATVLTRDLNLTQKRIPDLFAHPALTWLQGDIGNFPTPPGTYEHFVHLASEVSQGSPRQKRLAQFNSIVRGTNQLLEFANAANAANFLFTSSGAVYGRQPAATIAIDEDAHCAADPCDPAFHYAQCKRMAEALCVSAHTRHGMQPKIARCFSFAGPGLPLDGRFAIGDFLLDALTSDEIIVRGDGSPIRSYLYAGDLVVWLLNILLRGHPCRPYNVGSEEAVSIGALAERIAQLVPGNPAVRILQPRSTGVDECYVPDCSRIKYELGVTMEVALAATIERTLDWCRTGLSRNQSPYLNRGNKPE